MAPPFEGLAGKAALLEEIGQEPEMRVFGRLVEIAQPEPAAKPGRGFILAGAETWQRATKKREPEGGGGPPHR